MSPSPDAPAAPREGAAPALVMSGPLPKSAPQKGAHVLRRAKDLMNLKVQAQDGDAGHLDDLYFDERDWTVRYIVVDTGPWILGRRVLVAPDAFLPLHWEKQIIPVQLTREQIEGSPDVDLSRPVSEEELNAIHTYYGWPMYWAGTTPLGTMQAGALAAASAQVAGQQEVHEERASAERQGPLLRSVRDLLGYSIQATDGEIGHVEDAFVDEEDWHIRYLLADTSNWWFGKHVLIARDWLQRVDWTEHALEVKVTRDRVRNAPEYDPQHPVDRRYERDLYEYYGVPGYWV